MLVTLTEQISKTLISNPAWMWPISSRISVQLLAVNI